jgi:Ca-activated chloride channel family protein
MSFGGIEFANPYVLGLLIFVPLMAWWYYQKQDEYIAEVRLSSTQGIAVAQSWKVKARPMLQVLQLLAITALILALARPQEVLKKENVNAEGIDIMLALDVSVSMLAKDFKPDRLEASKAVAAEFVEQRKHDRIGLVVFAGESFTQCPLTTDHNILRSFLSTLECGLIKNGTAIGMGLANASKRLKDSDAKSKVIILLTDGENNMGYASPMQATDAAKKLGIKVYTIGVGTKGQAQVPVAQRPNGSFIYGWQQVHIDEELLQKIAEETGGEYFRAQDMTQLKAIYSKIDVLERTKIETTTIRNYKEKYHFFVLLAICFVFIQVLLANTLFKTIVR